MKKLTAGLIQSTFRQRQQRYFAIFFFCTGPKTLCQITSKLGMSEKTALTSLGILARKGLCIWDQNTKTYKSKRPRK